MDRHCATKTVALVLSLLLVFAGCSQNVVLRSPYPQKLRIGDGLKLTLKDGIIHSGRIVYMDRAVVVIRTPSQISQKRPVKSERFGTSIPWQDVVQVRASGTLDSHRKFVSSEEIRVNKRTRQAHNLVINLGLVGLGAGFLAGTWVQDNISPPGANPTAGVSGASKLAFWSTFIGTTVAAALIGNRLGTYLDNRLALERIERQRMRERETQAQVDSLLTKTREKINQMMKK